MLFISLSSFIFSPNISLQSSFIKRRKNKYLNIKNVIRLSNVKIFEIFFSIKKKNTKKNKHKLILIKILH